MRFPRTLPSWGSDFCCRSLPLVLSYPSLCVWEGDRFPLSPCSAWRCWKTPGHGWLCSWRSEACSKCGPPENTPPSVFWGEEAVNKGSRKRKAGPRPSRSQAVCPRLPLATALLCQLAQDLGTCLLLSCLCSSVPGGGGSPATEYGPPLSPSKRECSGPFPGSVSLTDAARNGPGITMLGTDPWIPRSC